MDVNPSQAAPFPPNDLIRSLIDLYWRHVALTFPVLEHDEFEEHYRRGLHYKSRQFEAVVLLVCAIGARYSDDPRVSSNSGRTPNDGWRHFLRGKDWMQALTPSTLSELQVFAVRNSFYHIDDIVH